MGMRHSCRTLNQLYWNLITFTLWWWRLKFLSVICSANVRSKITQHSWVKLHILVIYNDKYVSGNIFQTENIVARKWKKQCIKRSRKFATMEAGALYLQHGDCLVTEVCVEKTLTFGNKKTVSCVSSKGNLKVELKKNKEVQTGVKKDRSHNQKCKNKKRKPLCEDGEVRLKEFSKKSSSVFTLDAVKQRFGSHISEEEEKHLQKLIANGSDREIFRIVYGGGKDKVWKCHLCGTYIVGYCRELTKHYTVEHDSEPVFVCQVCEKMYENYESYKRHIQRHFCEYSCSECDKVFNVKHHYKSHLRRHKKEKAFKCDECGKCYKSMTILRNHKRYMHTDNATETVLCEICGKILIRRSSLNPHLRLHVGGESVHCDICGKIFTRKSSLKHHQQQHTGEKLFHCQHCEQRFMSNQGLKNHQRLHTGEKPYQCDVCGRSFHTKWSLHSHALYSHVNIKKYSCDICNKTFKTKKCVKNHRTVHTGEMPYVCDRCGRRFRMSSNFRTHKKVHLKHDQTETDKGQLLETSVGTSDISSEGGQSESNIQTVPSLVNNLS